MKKAFPAVHGAGPHRAADGPAVPRHRQVVVAGLQVRTSGYRRLAYFGTMISTACPRCSSSRLNPDTTSPRPPALAAGAHSGATMTTYIVPPLRNTRGSCRVHVHGRVQRRQAHPPLGMKNIADTHGHTAPMANGTWIKPTRGKRLQQSGLAASPAASALQEMPKIGSTARLTPWFRSQRACVAPSGLRIASSGAVECDVYHAMAALCNPLQRYAVASSSQCNVTGPG